MAKTWKPGDPRPRPDADVPGYAPRPRGHATPKPLRTTPLAPGALKPKWTPNAGWKPARFQDPSLRASIYGSRAVDAAGPTEFKNRLREGSRSFMSPLAGGGGGDPKSQKKK